MKAYLYYQECLPGVFKEWLVWIEYPHCMVITFLFFDICCYYKEIWKQSSSSSPPRPYMDCFLPGDLNILCFSNLVS